MMNLIRFILFLTASLLFVTAKEADPADCPANKWRCSNGQCIWRDWRCDGQVHCDGSDEQHCENWECSSTWWKCGNNQCIWMYDRCDGDTDCADGSDEDRCEEWTCPYDMWKCRNNLCVFRSQRCDGENDCGDRSDEKHCVITAVENLTLNGINNTVTVNEITRTTMNVTCLVFGLAYGHISITRNSENDNYSFPSRDLHYRRIDTWTYEAQVTLSEVKCDDKGIYTCAPRYNTSEGNARSVLLNVTCVEGQFSVWVLSGATAGGSLALILAVAVAVVINIRRNRAPKPPLSSTETDESSDATTGQHTPLQAARTVETSEATNQQVSDDQADPEEDKDEAGALHVDACNLACPSYDALRPPCDNDLYMYMYTSLK